MYRNQPQVPTNIVKEIIQKGRSELFPLGKLNPRVKLWYESMAFSRNTRPEFVFLSSLSVVNCIVGPKTKVQIRPGSEKSGSVKYPRRAYVESSGLFVIILSEPGSGKSNAFNLAIQEPLAEQENHILQSLLIQDYTKKGLFDFLRSHHGLGLMSSGEMQTFFDTLMRKHFDGFGERNMLNTLYDGTSLWSMTSAGRKVEDGKEKREELKENSFSISGFSQPEPFINSYRSMASVRDGFSDRLLACTIQPKLLKETEVRTWDNTLDEFNIHSFHTIYNEIYEQHVDGREYTFSKEANDVYVEFSDNAVSESNDLWSSGCINTNNYSKDKRNMARIALGLHILTTTIEKFLTYKKEEEMILTEEDIPTEIGKDTMIFSKEIIQYFGKQREILNMVFKDSKKKSEFSVDDNFVDRLFKYFQLVLSKEDKISLFMVIRKDGIAFRSTSAPGCSFSNEEISQNLKSRGFCGTSKPIYFEKVKQRAFVIGWKLFRKCQCEILKKLLSDNHGVDSQVLDHALGNDDDEEQQQQDERLEIHEDEQETSTTTNRNKRKKEAECLVDDLTSTVTGKRKCTL